MSTSSVDTGIGTGALAARRSRFRGIGHDTVLHLLEKTIDPCATVFSLWAITYLIKQRLEPNDLLLSLLVFSLTFPGVAHLRDSLPELLRRIALSWVSIAALLLFFGYATEYIYSFDTKVIFIWLCLAPASQLTGHLLLRMLAPGILAQQGNLKRVVIGGMNPTGLALARQMSNDRYAGQRILGFFDDRDQPRLQQEGALEEQEFPLLGQLSDLPAQIKSLHVDQLFLSLPMAAQPRILALLDELRDTTVSIYFVPDTFVTDLIQARVAQVGTVPVIAVCDTPFTGLNGLLKRGSDIVLSLLILLLISPVMLGLAIAIKAGSPGPAIFRQRRYGLDGEEIIVYKFRSMRVCEDGGQVTQAKRNDDRITPLGAFIRKTSLDELPQFINVLQGRMSIVGPRPHAVAHNEMYRKLIKGYMVRHKVKPGITGWAQVNGLRGETETLDKMQARIEHDLDYLRNWSLSLDLRIIARTVLLVIRDRQAY